MASGKDIKAATETYNGFVKVTAWSTGIVILVVAFVVALIAQ